MSTVVIPQHLREQLQTERVQVSARNVQGLLRELEGRFPGFGALLGENYAVAIDGEVFHDALLEPVPPQGEVHFLPALSGGSGGLNLERD